MHQLLVILNHTQLPFKLFSQISNADVHHKANKSVVYVI